MKYHHRKVTVKILVDLASGTRRLLTLRASQLIINAFGSQELYLGGVTTLITVEFVLQLMTCYSDAGRVGRHGR